jgi:diguanylate cyclase
VPTPSLLLRLRDLLCGFFRASRSRTYQRRSARISRGLGIAGWSALLICGAVLLLTPASGSGRKVAESAGSLLIASLFVILSARLVAASIAWRERRSATTIWLASLVLWGTGSAVLSAVEQPDLLAFPAPGEGFFLASYALMAIFLGLDANRGKVQLSRILEAVVICGGAICLTGMVLVSPLEKQMHGEGSGELLALLYPLLDLLMLTIVTADVVLRRRAWSRQTACLLLGFAGMATADSTFVRNLTGGTYDFSGGLMLLWALSLALLTAGGCGPRIGLAKTAKDEGSVWVPLAAAAAAVTVLVFTGGGTSELYLKVPAVTTLVAAGFRLALALREARAVTAAFRLSLTDELTGLPNRRALMARLKEPSAGQPTLGLLLVGLDGFKEVNDTLGHVNGDGVLRLLATRLRETLGAGTMLARLGGDEFAVLMPVTSPDHALEAAEHLREVIAEPIEAHDHLFSMNASIGVALRKSAGGSADDGAEVLRRADIAMYQAKTAGVGQSLYDRERDDFSKDRLKMAEYLRYGIGAGELRVWYQPQVDAADGSLVGLEALVRWQHPEQGLLYPGDFLGIARHAGLMPALTEAVIASVLSDMRAWCAKGLKYRVSFNFAPPELLNAPLLSRVLARIDAESTLAGLLSLEVTEDSFLAEPERALAALAEIRRHDVEVSIDDYGVGFSSLSYLRDMPVHELKLDRSFISAILTDPRTRIIVDSTASLARGLGLRTVAEGVEDEQVLEAVRDLGIDVIQGYHISRPMPSSQVADWIGAHDRERRSSLAG